MGKTSRYKKQSILWLLIAAALAAVPLVLDAETSYVVFLLFSAFIYVTLTQAWNLVAGYTGQVSLGNHAFFGLGAYIIAIGWSRGVIGYLDPFGMLLAGCGAAMLGVLVGIPLLSKLRGDYFALGLWGLERYCGLSRFREKRLLQAQQEFFFRLLFLPPSYPIILLPCSWPCCQSLSPTI